VSVAAAVVLCRHWSSDPDNEVKFPLFISLDGSAQPTLLLATSLKYAAPIQVIQNIRDPSHCNGLTDGYCWLSHHYKMLLQLFFVCLKAPRLIFLEEDLEISPDFFSYFAATAPLMDQDSSLMCVSAWNDHGQQGRVRNSSQLYRTDVLPGLGWMLPAAVGLEALPGWPGAGWDEWMRDQRFTKGRQCVFPEGSRTHTFGANGASGGIFYKEHLALMVLNQQPVDWAQQVGVFH
jgi:alpha-1,3-mannosyl-glycoprotein beta-1,2-N-acetylglucosaminyltransferase